MLERMFYVVSNPFKPPATTSMFGVCVCVQGRISLKGACLHKTTKRVRHSNHYTAAVNNKRVEKKKDRSAPTIEASGCAYHRYEGASVPLL